MKAIRFLQSVSIQNGFLISSYKQGEEYFIKDIKYTEGLKTTIVLQSGQVIFLNLSEFEVIDKEYLSKELRLYYRGQPTQHFFDFLETPDIRLLGYDINEEHEFKIITKIL